MEDVVQVPPVNRGEQTQDPPVEKLVMKLRRLQQGKKSLEEEMKEIVSVRDSLQKELETLQTDAYQLEGIQKEKEECCGKLQFQFDKSEQDSTRQLNQNKKSQELMEEYRCEIQEFKLKQRKQRMKFEKQLHQLMEQHKNLRSIFTPERLPDEIENTESRKSQLESAEQLKLAQLHHLDQELEDVRKQKQMETTAADTTCAVVDVEQQRL